jgi:plasmid stability protein
MPDLTVHAIPQEDFDALDARATRHGRDTEREVLHLIHEAAAGERLVQQLESARRAEQVIRRSGPAAPRPRFRTLEPTPHRTRHPYRDSAEPAMDPPNNAVENR